MTSILPLDFAERVNRREHLVWRGRHLETTLLLQADDDSWLIDIHRGRIESIRPGPFVMPRWRFTLRASAQVWQQFFNPHPVPGFHDLMALIKYRHLRAEGDLYPLMSHLLYFKEVLACARPQGDAQ